MPKATTRRAGWTTVAFGDVVHLSTERSSNPESDGLERFVGLDHIEPGDLRIRRWGEVADGTTFTSVFRPGQVLFGKRRAYQRKVAVAEFSGVCSGDIYVLEPKGKHLLPELLPFICQTDAFFEHAVGTSAGSLSPRTNWTSLSGFEFALPPIEEQRRIVSALKSAADCQGAHLATADIAAVAQEALVENRMRGLSMGSIRRHERVGRYCGTWRVIRLGELVTMAQYGLSDIATDTGQFPMLRMMNLESGRVVENDLKYIDLNPAEHLRYRLANGDVLFNRTNSNDLVGRTGVYELGGDHVFASYLVRLRTDGARLNPAYLCAFLNAPVGRRQVMSFATRGVSQTNVNATSLRRVLIPLPPVEYQLRTIAALRSLSDISDSARSRAAEAGRMIARIINAELTR